MTGDDEFDGPAADLLVAACLAWDDVIALGADFFPFVDILLVFEVLAIIRAGFRLADCRLLGFKQMDKGVR
jgi:hypothetical protein